MSNYGKVICAHAYYDNGLSSIRSSGRIFFQTSGTWGQDDKMDA